jgi:SET domain-containing protein
MSDHRATLRVDDDGTLEVVDLDEQRGLGVRALRGFSGEDVIHHFTGKVSDQRGLHTLQIDPTRHIGDTRYIGYLTHGCDPNAVLDMENFVLVARRDIASGEIVTIDYSATEDRLHRQFPCACGAAECRGWITGRTESPNEAGRAALRKRRGY